jgi:predicted nucleotidyltransferase
LHEHVFGSYAKGLQTPSSDVDIVIDSNGKLLNINFYGVLEDITQCLDKRVDLIEISEIQKDSPIYYAMENEGVILMMLPNTGRGLTCSIFSVIIWPIPRRLLYAFPKCEGHYF